MHTSELVDSHKVDCPQKFITIFSSICHADSENVIKNSVSAWTLEGRADGAQAKK